jgi:hypothetical protein
MKSNLPIREKLIAKVGKEAGPKLIRFKSLAQPSSAIPGLPEESSYTLPATVIKPCA